MLSLSMFICLMTCLFKSLTHVFGMDGKQQHTYQYDSNKHRLFTGPRRITTNNNKDIVVVDSTSVVTGQSVFVTVILISMLLFTIHTKDK
jgi:hypothetical protein